MPLSHPSAALLLLFLPALLSSPAVLRTTTVSPEEPCVDLEQDCSKDYCFSEWYMVRCKKTCKDCDGYKLKDFRRILHDFTICRDAYPGSQCRQWQRYGGCNDPNSSVFYGCRKSCGLCRKLRPGSFSWNRNPPASTTTAAPTS